MTPGREQFYRIARRRLAQCREAMQFLIDVQEDPVGVAQLKLELRYMKEAIDDFAKYQCGIHTVR